MTPILFVIKFSILTYTCWNSSLGMLHISKAARYGPIRGSSPAHVKKETP